MHSFLTFFNVSLYITNKWLIVVTKRYSNAVIKLDNSKVTTMKVLNVAEKNDAAKHIAGYISRGTAQRREGLSKFNKIYEFNARLWNQNCQMIMTSVSGHLLSYEFVGYYRKWYGCPPLTLFEAPVTKVCPDPSYEKIKKTLMKEVKTCNALIIWTDCDREGENIGFEIINVCKAVKPNIQVYRAKFSEITQISIDRALQNLEEPNKAASDAVDVRSELDLRIGAAFTRFQTMRLQKVFPRNLADMLISYGPCQFPTLGFVVERFLAIERFEPEPYWKLKVTHVQNDLSVEFRWARNRLFEKLPCEVFLDICQENPQATVEKVTSKPKSKWRPLPLDTIELEKQGSRKLRLSAKETMKIAEKLYAQGFISYPRTETNIFPKEMNLTPLVTAQAAENSGWSGFAQRLLEEGINPRQGKKSDQAHPPIHPLKYAHSLQGNEAKVYEFVVRHFLACLSKNAEGFETIVEIDIAGEKFITNGLQIIAKNYLEVYIYEKWNAKEIHIYERGQTFMPTSIEMLEEMTSPPNLLTEADLIALMDKHGIGTDATHAEHIETIKSRQYVGIKDEKYLIPGKLGIGLVMGYDRMGFHMSKPHLRAELENDLKLICEGQKTPEEVIRTTITKYSEVYKEVLIKANLIDGALADYLDEQPLTLEQENILQPEAQTPILKCPKCNFDMVIKTKRQGNGKYIGCVAYPTCNNVIWLPEGVEDIEVLEESCNQCPDNILKKVKLKLARNVFPVFGTSYSTCIGGCDEMFNNLMRIRANTVRRVQDLDDTGYETNASSAHSTTTQRWNVSGSTNVNTNTVNIRPSQQSQTTMNRQTSRNQPSQSQSHPNNRNNNVSGSSWSSGVGSTSSSNRNNFVNTSNENSSWNRQNSSTNITSNNASTSYNWNDESNSDIMCNCHQIAKQLTVRKEGPNQGRIFYKCAKPVGEDCNFFLWGSDVTSEVTRDNGVAQQSAPNNRHQSVNFQSNRSNYQNSSSNRQNNQDTFSVSGNWDDGNVGGGWNADRDAWNNQNEVMCNCSNPARKLTVNKEGPNKGRQFYGCPQGANSSCNFFQWADAIDGGNSSHNRNDWSRSQNRGQGSRGGSGRGRSGSPPLKKARTTGAGGNKRKCGVCGVEGHTRRTCPQNTFD